MSKYEFKLGQRIRFTLTNDDMVKIEDIYTEDTIVIPKNDFWTAALTFAQFKDGNK